MSNPLEIYLEHMSAIRRSGGGVKETSYYPALSNLLDEVGKTLKPKVRCIQTLKNTGVGLPDFGLYSAEQFQKARGDLRDGQLPSRGCIEVKGVGENIIAVAEDKQVRGYLSRYKQVLVTNYRDFVLVGDDPDGNPVNRERFTLVGNENEFWDLASRPRAAANQTGERFVEYLKRVMLSAAPIAEPKDVAWFLASYARDAKARIEHTDLPALGAVRGALEEALGLKFEGEKGEHFFRSTLVQTLFYGVFSAWVLWSKKHPPADRRARFTWKEAAWSLHVPMIRALFEQIATPTKLEPLGLTEVLDWTEGVLNRVDRAAFFSNFEEEHAVQYFYEPFLEAFDPELRKELGVWYTPTEVVQYMVARVDTVLREELDISDGLADPRVYVLDPCCGTGAFLVEVLRRIDRTLAEKGDNALRGNAVKKAAMERVFGFEILPAPFVVSHLQLGILLQNLEAPFGENPAERAGVFLTNALTGWDPPSEEVKRRLKQLEFSFSELKAEHDAAEKVKRDAPILVVLGNPPYNAFAGISPMQEAGLVEPYKEGLISEWGIKKFNLDDLYVRFFRLAERRIAEKSGRGIVCFISNFSYLFEPSYVVMRRRLVAEFDKLWFDSLNGDSRETGKLTPSGQPDPSVFSTTYNREGIRVGTVVGLLARFEKRREKPVIAFRQFWGANKRTELLRSADEERGDSSYVPVNPNAINRFSFRPSNASTNYLSWPKLSELSALNYNGPVERRGFALISIDREKLESRLAMYFDLSRSDDEVEREYGPLMMTGNRIVGPIARKKILREFKFDSSRIVRYPFKPFDVRWCYLENLRPLFSEPSPQLLSLRPINELFLITRDTADKTPEGPPVYPSRLVCDYDFISGHARHLPARITPHGISDNKRRNRRAKSAEAQTSLLAQDQAIDKVPQANLSTAGQRYIEQSGIASDGNAAAMIWLHASAVGFSRLYLEENADGLRSDWPRIPLPSRAADLTQSIALGKRIADLLDPDVGIVGITEGTIIAPFRSIGSITRVGGGQLYVGNDGPTGKASELRVAGGWGHAGKGGVTMPGKGRIISRRYSQTELTAFALGGERLGLRLEEMVVILGLETADVYLNEVAYWCNIPMRVWEYTIGGYQVMKKWLSYREFKLLGRPITPDEAREVTNMARRIAAILLMEPELDANYEAVKAATYDWPK